MFIRGFTCIFPLFLAYICFIGVNWKRFFALKHAVWYLSRRTLYSIKSATSCSLKTMTLFDFTSKGIPLFESWPLISNLHPSFLNISFFLDKFYARINISYLNSNVNWSNRESTIISIISKEFKLGFKW